MPKRKKDAPWPVKAYKNVKFLTSPDARLIRVLSELLEPEAKFEEKKIKNTVVFFGSAKTIPESDAAEKLKEIEKKIKKAKKPLLTLKRELQKAKMDHFMSRYYEDAALLSEKLTRWFKQLQKKNKYFMLCSGGGPGIMEAANRGASIAGSDSIGLNISIPTEQIPNSYQTKDISCEFHYFFIRKFWFVYLAKAMVVFPGGYGTLDELFELLTLIQTEKVKRRMPIVLYGSKYWKSVINFDLMVKYGVLEKKDLNLFEFCDDVNYAFRYLKSQITKHYL